MKLKTQYSKLETRNSKLGMTLAEVMVAVGVGTMVMLLVVLIFMTSSRSFAAMGNYINMDRASRSALDQMTRDIRRANGLTSFTSNKIVFAWDVAGATNLTYTYDAATRTLTQSKTGQANKMLLTNCDSLTFSMWKNTPLSGGTLGTASTVSEAKAIGVAWKCSGTILGKKLTTEDMQQAQIVIRNKKVL